MESEAKKQVVTDELNSLYFSMNREIQFTCVLSLDQDPQRGSKSDFNTPSQTNPGSGSLVV